MRGCLSHTRGVQAGAQATAAQVIWGTPLVTLGKKVTSIPSELRDKGICLWAGTGPWTQGSANRVQIRNFWAVHKPYTCTWQP